tara:strand:- start:44 stop:238 length:195 start_codon:yes stop_codon:yes gene_type:complete
MKATAETILINHGFIVVSNQDRSYSVADPLGDIDGYYLTGNDKNALCVDAASSILGILISGEAI